MLTVDVTGQTKAVSLGSVVMVRLINTATELSHHFCMHQTNQKVGLMHFQQNIVMPDQPCTHEYYKWFIPNEEQKCHCSNMLQT